MQRTRPQDQCELMDAYFQGFPRLSRRCLMQGWWSTFNPKQATTGQCCTVLYVKVNLEDFRSNRRLTSKLFRSGHLDAVKLLLAAGAIVDLKSVDGWGALHMASANGQHNASPRSEFSSQIQQGHREVIDVLLDAGAVADLKNNDGRTALHVAADEGSFSCTGLYGVISRPGTDQGTLTSYEYCSLQGQTQLASA